MSASETRTLLEDAGFHVRHLRYWNSLLLPLMIAQRKILARHRAARMSPLFRHGWTGYCTA